MRRRDSRSRVYDAAAFQVSRCVSSNKAARVYRRGKSQKCGKLGLSSVIMRRRYGEEMVGAGLRWSRPLGELKLTDFVEG